MLILDVRVDIAPQYDDTLNEWYHTHVPRLVSLPGYASGRRYLSLTQGPRYAALYEIEDSSYLPSLLGADEHRRQPLTVSEWAEWDRRFVPHMNYGCTNLYASTDKRCPILVGDTPIVEVHFEGDREAGALCDDQLLSGLEHSGAVIRATRLQASIDPQVEWLGTRPCNLLLLQVRDDAAAVELAAGGELAAELRDRGVADEIDSVAYRQIARHWPYNPRSNTYD